jgi:3-oxoacyl-[acyl-carrier protein] reductase
MGILDGRVGIVTGASSGIGRGCAFRFAEEGATVVCCARGVERLETVVDAITSKGGQAVAIPCDVGVEDDITNVVGTTAERYGRIDFLANIAQGFLPTTGYTDVLGTTRENLLDLFITGPLQSLLFMQKCFPHMKEQGYGRIVNTSSAAHIVGSTAHVPYGIAKAGITALSRHASQDWGQYGIVTNTIYPVTTNEVWEAAPENQETVARLPLEIPVRFLGDAYEDLSPVIAFLVSEGAGYVNGQSIGIDGGLIVV